MTTVWINVDTSKQVGDRDHLKVFEERGRGRAVIQRERPEGLPLNTRFRAERSVVESHANRIYPSGNQIARVIGRDREEM